MSSRKPAVARRGDGQAGLQALQPLPDTGTMRLSDTFTRRLVAVIVAGLCGPPR